MVSTLFCDNFLKKKKLFKEGRNEVKRKKKNNSRVICCNLQGPDCHFDECDCVSPGCQSTGPQDKSRS